MAASMTSACGACSGGADCEAFCGEWSLDHTLAPIGRPTGNIAVDDPRVDQREPFGPRRRCA
jgi:hypothetical protein